MDTIKDIWYAVTVNDIIESVHRQKEDADAIEEAHFNVKVERVQVTIDRIKTS